MTNPLTLFVPIKQDADTQKGAHYAHDHFIKDVQKGLDITNIVHYARISLIPNASGEGIYAILVITEFDGPMNPYLKVFWDNPATQVAFAGVAAAALNPPSPPVVDLTGFENFINNNNLNGPGDMYSAYPQTVKEIKKAFKK